MSFQAATGIDWKPGVEVPDAASSSASLGADIDGKIKAQGDAVRKLKSNCDGDFFVYQVMPIVCPRKKSICK